MQGCVRGGGDVATVTPDKGREVRKSKHQYMRPANIIDNPSGHFTAED